MGSPPVAGQVVLLVVAKAGSMLVSLYMRFRKAAHRANPMAWPPERTVMSWAVRPLAANIDMSVARLEDGPGIWLLAAL